MRFNQEFIGSDLNKKHGMFGERTVEVIEHTCLRNFTAVYLCAEHIVVFVILYTVFDNSIRSLYQELLGALRQHNFILRYIIKLLFCVSQTFLNRD